MILVIKQTTLISTSMINYNYCL